MADETRIASACNRFGLGARPGDLERRVDAGTLLLGQLRAQPLIDAFAVLPSSATYLHEEAVALQRLREGRRERATGIDNPAGAPPDATRRDAMGTRGQLRARVRSELDARYRHAVTTPDGFAERIVRFWSNHFAVSIDKRTAALLAAPMEREAVRPHAFGTFADLLVAVERHPAMLRYLDNARSIGPESRLAQRLKSRGTTRTPGLNENLAREILELHTLGVDGGYVQADVTELARAITGWSTPAPRDVLDAPPPAAFVFRTAAHEGGVRTVLGRRYADAGPDQGLAILRDLATHPATARHVCTKLARHFVADDPPPALVERMVHAWTASGGRLPDVYRALVDADEAWAADARKFKTPEDYLVSALRALGADDGIARLQPALAQLGEPAFTPRSPAGFPDTAAAWSGGDALFKRIQLAQRLAFVAADVEPLALARAALGSGLDATTATAIRRAESARSGVALLFASPAFQWRT